MVAQGLGQQLSAGPGLGLAQLLSIDGADAAVHVDSAAAAVSWVQEAARRRFTAAAFQGLATEGSTGSCPAGFGVAQDYRMYKVAGRARRDRGAPRARRATAPAPIARCALPGSAPWVAAPGTSSCPCWRRRAGVPLPAEERLVHVHPQAHRAGVRQVVSSRRLPPPPPAALRCSQARAGQAGAARSSAALPGHLCTLQQLGE